MRKVCLILTGLFLCIGDADAAERVVNTVSRQTTKNEVITPARSTKRNTVTTRASSHEQQNQQVSSRTAKTKTVMGRSTVQKTSARQSQKQPTRMSRAATNVSTKTFSTNYNYCRDAYFTCMDQFCATLDDTYRRCVCSSKLSSIKKQEKKLSQTEDSLKDFEDLNIDAISKTASEVKSMSSASAGEKAIRKDRSKSEQTLQNISSVLKNSKHQSLSTNGTLDIAGDIKQIWSTTDLIGGSNIADLTGEALFNAVHTQCNELVKEDCASSDLKMIASAYGMYIENDCSVIQNEIDKKMVVANAAIRETRHKMQDARLENYDAHNSLNINDCVARVYDTLTDDLACGTNFVHCLDFSGKYLNATTGAAIYSPDFYQIENQLSLSGDVLKNGKNAAFITMLNKKRDFAEQDLDLCRDNADEVWNEFMRQAIVEIYQGQQKRVSDVKAECLQVVNKCYLNKSESLQNFSDSYSQMVFVKTLELSEEMCADKLNTCSNLYGGGPEGLNTLITTMTGITDLTIEQSCPDLLAMFARSICAVPESDSGHYYPYGCRKYAPGENYYASNPLCNTTLVNPFSRSDILTTQTITENYNDYLGVCKDYRKKYTKCNFGYYLYDKGNYSECNASNNYCFSLNTATECRPCPNQCNCPGTTSMPESVNAEIYENCGQYYIGSLYQQLVIYALQNCTRSTDTSNVLSKSLLAEVDKVAKSVRKSLITMLSKECSDLGGVWVDSVWKDENNNGYHDNTGDVLLSNFYITTGANKLWGYCKDTTQ